MNDVNENLISFEMAKELMHKSLSKNKTEKIELNKSEDRILAENISSKINIPEYSNSAVDGFGFINSNKKEFKVVGESKPGKPFLGKVKNDEAIKVFTGAYVIKKITNIDTVCMEEDTEKKGDKIILKKKIKKGSNIRLIGEDVKKNSKVFSLGRKIRSVDLSQLSSLGLKKIKVYKKLKVEFFHLVTNYVKFQKRKRNIKYLIQINFHCFQCLEKSDAKQMI